MSDLDFSEISMEQKGVMVLGRVKMTDTQIHFKPKAGKIFTISSTDIELVNWMRIASSWGIRIFTNAGTLVRFSGFKESDKEKLGKGFSNRFGKNMVDMDVCVKGWNWGTAKFKGSVLTFDVANGFGFDMPLAYVSQCTTGKNEVTLEFHQNDEARDTSLMELRFHMPSSENAGDTEPVDAFKEQVLNKADIIGAVGDAIAIFREIHCLTPRGRYDIKAYHSFFQLHGKTFDYKIPMTTVLRLFLLPHIDGRQIFFVISLDPPIKQGQTRYHFLVFLFATEENCSIELPFTEKELETKYGGKLEKDLAGPTYQVVSKIMKVLLDRKITGPGKYLGHSNQPAVSCSYKAAAGYLYPMERGFMFIHKPPIHIRSDEVSGVNFVRSGGGTKSFDFEIELKSGVVHTFVSILKEEYGKLSEFMTSKGVRIKSNHEKIDYIGKYDGKGEPDAYLERVKAEAQERSDNDDVDSESSEDEDYKQPTKTSDVSDDFEYDSEAAISSGGGSDDASAGAEKSKSKPKKKERKESDKSGKKKEITTRSKKDKDGPSKRKGRSGKKDGSGKKDDAGASGEFKSKEFISDSGSD